MRTYRFVQVDVFAEGPFTGNALAVFPQAAGLSGEEMQAIAREMTLSETPFVTPPKGATRFSPWCSMYCSSTGWTCRSE